MCRGRVDLCAGSGYAADSGVAPGGDVWAGRRVEREPERGVSGGSSGTGLSPLGLGLDCA